MNAIATGLPLLESFISDSRNTAKEEKKKVPFGDLLQDSLTSTKAETGKMNSMSGKDKKTVMHILQNENFMPGISGEEQTKISTFDQILEIDLPERLTQIHEADEFGLGSIPTTLNPGQLQYVFNRLTKISSQVVDDDAIETIMTAFLEAMEKNTEPLDESVPEEERLDQLHPEAEAVLAQDVLHLPDHQLTKTNTAGMEPQQLLDLTKLMLAVESDHPEQQRKIITTQAKRIIGQVESHKDADKAVKPLLKLLEAWSALGEEQQPKQDHSDRSLTEKAVSKQEQIVWQKLTQLYQKQKLSIHNQQQTADTKAISQEVKKVLLNARNDLGNEKQSANTSPSLSGMPMAKVEQFVVHLQQQQNSQTIDQQLMDQFQKAMKTSKFFTGNNGTSQLNIALKPDNLGDMMIKLTQMNGEMTVKITVSAQAAKDMLESNIQQLKHMFSPNQVVIEKQDVNSQMAQVFDEEHDEQPMQEQEQGRKHHDGHQEDNQQDQQQEDSDVSFYEWLRNEKMEV